MTKKSLYHRIKHVGTSRGIGIILLGFVLFVLTFLLEYTHSTKHGDLEGEYIDAGCNH